MSIPLYIFLIIYAFFLLSFILFAIFNLYHLFKFGIWDFAGFLMTFLFFGITIIILFLTWQYGGAIDWSETFNLFGNNHDPNNFDILINQ